MDEEKYRSLQKEILTILKFIETLQEAVIDMQSRMRELEGSNQ